MSFAEKLKDSDHIHQVETTNLNIVSVDKAGSFWQPSSLGNYTWSAINPETVVQEQRIYGDSDFQLLFKAATAVPFDQDMFDDQTKSMSTAAKVHHLLTSARFQFNGTQAVRSEPIWLQRIASAVEKSEPIVIAYPLMCKIGNWAKQMYNVGPNGGEIACFLFFKHINQIVQRIYPPGIKIIIVCDAQLYNSAFQNAEVEVAHYIRQITSLVQRLGASSSIEIVNYCDVLSEFAVDYQRAYHDFHLQLKNNRDSIVGKFNADSLFQSVKASINTRRMALTYEDHKDLFCANENTANSHHSEVNKLAMAAFDEVMCIRFACAQINAIEKTWPHHIRATCHKGLKDGRAVIGLRVYPEYYGSSKLLPYHGMPIIKEDNKKVRLEIHPEVILRANNKLVRVHTEAGETIFYHEKITQKP